MFLLNLLISVVILQYVHTTTPTYRARPLGRCQIGVHALNGPLFQARTAGIMHCAQANQQLSHVFFCAVDSF